jgi:hypothetical protein
VYLYGSWRGLPYPSFLDLVFQGHIVILGSRRLGRFAIIKTVGKRKIDRVAEKQNELKLGDNTLHFKSETPHLGLTRSNSVENRINIEERIALGRRTLYSLIKTGVHGTNGLNPKTSCKIYQVYSDEKASRSAHIVLSPGYFSN